MEFFFLNYTKKNEILQSSNKNHSDLTALQSHYFSTLSSASDTSYDGAGFPFPLIESQHSSHIRFHLTFIKSVAAKVLFQCWNQMIIAQPWIPFMF